VSLSVTVALVDETHRRIPAAELSQVAAALNAQWHNDFLPLYPQVRGSVVVYPLGAVPPRTWQLRLLDDLDDPGALGYHTDDGNQPFAVIDATDAGDWHVTASHELLEMLADPWGNSMHGARLPLGTEAAYKRFGLPHASSHVHYLLEVCDPCEAFTYEQAGVQLSDFLLLPWYRTNPGAAHAYSFTGALMDQREVADGGYVSFEVPQTGHWWQLFNRSGRLSVQDLGRFDKARSGGLREFTDHHARVARSDESRLAQLDE
jgi:hypothetical protein